MPKLLFIWLGLLLWQCGMATVSPGSGLYALASRSPADPHQPASPITLISHLKFSTVTDQNGLPQNTIMSVGQDQAGYLWVATQDGAAYYNGRVWTVVKMPAAMASNDIRAMLMASDGSIWFGTYSGGLARLKDNQWTVFDSTSGLVSNHIRCLLETKSATGSQVIWVGTRDGLGRLEAGRWQTFDTTNGLPDRTVKCLLETRNNQGAPTLWVGTFNGGLAAFQDGKWSVYTTAQGLPGNEVNCLLATRWHDQTRTTLWIGTRNGLGYFHRGGIVKLTTESGLPENEIRGLAEVKQPDGHNRLWVGTYGGGIATTELIFSPQVTVGYHWQVLNAQSGLSDLYIRCFFQQEGANGTQTLWIGTDGGLVKHEFGKWNHRELRINDVSVTARSFLEVDEPFINPVFFWIGTVNHGLVQTGQWPQRQSPRVFDTRSGLPDNTVRSLLRTKSTSGSEAVWIGTNGGIVQFENDRLRPFQIPAEIARSPIRTLLETSSENGTQVLWVGTNDGLARYEKNDWQIFTTHNGLPNNEILSLLETRSSTSGKKTLWVGTYGGGLARLEDNRWMTYDTKSGLPNNVVGSLLETTSTDGRHMLWIGTDGGLVRLDLTTPVPGFSMWSDATQPALPNNVIYGLCEDAQKRIYLFTSKGIARLTPRRQIEPGEPEFDIYTFTTDDGLPGNQCVQGALYQDRSGKIWVGMVGGIAVFDPKAEIFSTVLPPLRIEQVRLGGQNVGEVDLASLSYDQNNLGFEFALLNFFRESEIRYQTHLVGFEPEHSGWVPDAKKEYTNLPEGQYTFRVWGKNHQGIISGPAEVRFAIRPAPWRTWWAYGLYLVGTIGLGYGILAWRLRGLKRRQEEKINFLSQLLESTRLINSQLDLTTVLQRIAEESAQLTDGEPGGIGLVEGNQVVFRRIWQQNHWEDAVVVFNFGEGIAGKVAATATSMIVNDPKSNPEIEFPEVIDRYFVYGLMDVPILSRTGKVVGVLDVRRRQNRAPFTEADCQIIEALANQAAVAIENAELYGELGEKNAELAQKNEELVEKNAVIAQSVEELEKLYRNEKSVSHKLQELNQMKTNFMVVTSHEMRTPLTVLKGYSEALAEEYLGPLTPAQKQSVKTCHRMVNRLENSFNDILEMLKINEGALALNCTEVDLSILVCKVVAELESFIQQRAQILALELPDRALLRGDVEKLELVLLNLLQNAIKFTHDGGQIAVLVKPEIETLHLSISDTGIGIEPQELEQVFEKFYTTSDHTTHTSGRFEFSARGTGLGLAIAKSYVEVHGGKIWAESAGKGKGSCFHVVLPVVGPSELPATSGQSSTGEIMRASEK